MTENLTHLHQSIVEHHDLEELRMLCFNLGVRYDDLRGEGLSAKTRDLVLQLGRNKRLDELLKTLRRSRPNMALFAPATPSDQVNPDAAVLKTLYAELAAFESAALPTPATRARTRIFLASITILLVCVVVLLAVLTARSTPAPVALATGEPPVTATLLAAATARPDEALLLVAEFKGQADYDPSTWIFSRLASDLKASALLDARIEQVPDVVQTADQAQALGQLYGATLVVWGTYDKFGVWPHYQVVHGQHLVGARVELAQTANLPSEPDHFALYITREMGSQLAYLSWFTLGQMAYFSGEYDLALDLFDEALSVQTEGDDVESSKATLFLSGLYLPDFSGRLASSAH